MVLEDTGGSWLGFFTLILIGIWSLVFGSLKFQILSLHLNFEQAKNTHILWVLIWVFAGHCRFLTWTWSLDLDLNIIKMQKTSRSFKSWFGALEDGGGKWLKLSIWILIFILIQSLIFDRPMFWIVALYLDLEGAKNIHVLKVLIWGFGGCWRFLTRVWHFDLDLDMITGLWYTHDPNSGSLSWFWRCKEHPCP